MDSETYIISGGDAGAERLRVLSSAMRSGTNALLDRAGIAPGLSVLDLGCGSGQVTLALARRVGPTGSVLGIDMDAAVLDYARTASDSEGLEIDWRQGDVRELDEVQRFDLLYARFLLSHLSDPIDMLRRMKRALRPGGKIIVEDIDITSHTHWPPSDAFNRYVELYAATARLRGADPSIGPRLPSLFIESGLTVDMFSVLVPTFLWGEEKSIARLTLANIADAAIAAGLTEGAEIESLLRAIVEHEENLRSIQSTAHVFQVIGYLADM